MQSAVSIYFKRCESDTAFFLVHRIKYLYNKKIQSRRTASFILLNRYRCEAYILTDFSKQAKVIYEENSSKEHAVNRRQS